MYGQNWHYICRGGGSRYLNAVNLREGCLGSWGGQVQNHAPSHTQRKYLKLKSFPFKEGSPLPPQQHCPPPPPVGGRKEWGGPNSLTLNQFNPNVLSFFLMTTKPDPQTEQKVRIREGRRPNSTAAGSPAIQRGAPPPCWSCWSPRCSRPQGRSPAARNANAAPPTPCWRTAQTHTHAHTHIRTHRTHAHAHTCTGTRKQMCTFTHMHTHA